MMLVGCTRGSYDCVDDQVSPVVAIGNGHRRELLVRSIPTWDGDGGYNVWLSGDVQNHGEPCRVAVYDLEEDGAVPTDAPALSLESSAPRFEGARVIIDEALPDDGSISIPRDPTSQTWLSDFAEDPERYEGRLVFLACEAPDLEASLTLDIERCSATDTPSPRLDVEIR